MSCDAELCPFWTGDGCACEVFDIDDEMREDMRNWIGIPVRDSSLEEDE